MVDDHALRLLEQDVSDLKRKADTIPRLEAEVEGLSRGMDQLREDQKTGFNGLKAEFEKSRSVQIKLLVTIAASTIAVILGLISTMGGPGA